MGSWGITERESDYGLDLLATIAAARLKAVDFSVFNVAEAMDVITAHIMKVIRKDCRGCSAETLVHFFSINFPQNFTHGALLIAECLADYYRTGELIVTEYTGAKHDPVERHIKEFIVTGDDLKILLDELQSVQNPEHEYYQSWISEDSRQNWLTHIQAVYQTLSEHL